MTIDDIIIDIDDKIIDEIPSMIILDYHRWQIIIDIDDIIIDEKNSGHRGHPSEIRVPIGSRSRPLQEVKLNIFPNAFWN